MLCLKTKWVSFFSPVDYAAAVFLFLSLLLAFFIGFLWRPTPRAPTQRTVCSAGKKLPSCCSMILYRMLIECLKPASRPIDCIILPMLPTLVLILCKSKLQANRNSGAGFALPKLPIDNQDFNCKRLWVRNLRINLCISKQITRWIIQTYPIWCHVKFMTRLITIDGFDSNNDRRVGAALHLFYL